MMTTTSQLTDDYLRRLTAAAQVLPRAERDELVAEIREHLALGVSSDATESDVRNLLDELGAPEDIVAAARGPQPAARPAKRGIREVLAVVLLVTGFPPIIGWLAGVVLLLSSPLWTGRQKLLGVLVWPGGLSMLGAVAFITVGRVQACSVSSTPTSSVTNCTGSGQSLWQVFFTIVVIAAPLLVGAYLYRAAGRAADTT